MPMVDGSKRRAMLGLAAAVLAGLAALPAAAQSPAFPSRPVKVIVAFGAGGSADVIVRLLSAKAGETLGQGIIIENKPGADSDLAGEAVARAQPDGYTLLFTSQALAVNASLRPKRPYKLEELSPVMLVAETQAVLVVPAGFEAKSVKDVLALARAKPGELDYGSTGVGTSGHLAMELFRITADIDVVHVPFRNIGQWMTDMIAGRIVLGMPTIPGATTHVRSGKLMALAVTGSRRSAALPDVPTVADAGLPGYAATTWYPLMVPRGTPDPVVTRLLAAFKSALDEPAIKTRLLDIGVEPVGSSPASLAGHLKTEVERWGKVVAQARISTE